MCGEQMANLYIKLRNENQIKRDEGDGLDNDEKTGSRKNKITLGIQNEKEVALHIETLWG